MAKAAKASTKKTAKKAATKTGVKKGNYTKPELREKVKDKVMKGSKGGRPGQWSARKAQLVASEYEKAGGGYRGEKSEKQEHLSDWGEEKWQTKTGKKAVHGKTTSRYLPKKAWDELSPEEKKKTEAKKVSGSKKGTQFVKNTKTAAAAGKEARTHKKTATREPTSKRPAASSGKKAAKKS